MAAVKRMRGVKLLIKVGDGATPTENFTALCTINAARSFSIKSATNRVVIPDCEDPDLPGWVATEKTQLTGDITGAGMVNTSDVPSIDAYARSGTTKNLQVHMDGVSAGDGGGYWQGAYHCTDFTVTGDKGGQVEASLAFESDGEVPFVPFS
jgi:hypothetical protein